jgi:hypothetical protein
VHTPPPNAKQNKLKYYQQSAQNNVSAKETKSKNDKTSSSHREKPLSTMDKRGLIRSMSWYHPTVSLEIRTVYANARRVGINGGIAKKT